MKQLEDTGHTGTTDAAPVKSTGCELLTRNPFDAPPSVVKRRVDYLNRMLDSDLAARGSSLTEYAQRDPDVYKRQEKQADEDVRLTEILKKSRG